MDQKYYEILIIKSLNREATENEISDLNQWLKQSEEHTLLEKKIKDAWKHSDHYYANIQLDENEAWHNIEPKITVLKNRFPLRWVSIAASVLLIIGAAFFIQNQISSNPDHIEISEYSNDSEQVKLIDLADGSKVRLSSDSYMSYEAGETRKATLSGEAYFEVKHDPNYPFEVHSDNTKVKVLGTSFNINGKNKNEIQVSLIEGSVAFEAENQSIILEPGEYASYVPNANELFKLGTFNPDKNYWLEQKLEFNTTSLENVVETLEHYFNTDIILKGNYSECTFTGIFRDPRLDPIIDALVFTFDIEKSKQGNAIVLFIKNCNS